MVKRGRVDTAGDTRPYFRKLYERAKYLGDFKKREIECYIPQKIGEIILYHVDGRKFLYLEQRDILIDLQDPWKQPTPKRIRRKSIYIWRDNALDIIIKRMQFLRISNGELSRLTGINKASIGRYISGKRKPRPEAAKKICDVLRLSFNDLYDEVDQYGNIIEPDYNYDEVYEDEYDEYDEYDD